MKSIIFKDIKTINIYFQYTGTKGNTKESPKWGKNIPKGKTDMQEKMKGSGKGKYVGKYKWILTVQNNNKSLE